MLLKRISCCLYVYVCRVSVSMYMRMCLFVCFCLFVCLFVYVIFVTVCVCVCRVHFLFVTLLWIEKQLNTKGAEKRIYSIQRVFHIFPVVVEVQKQK